jgi:ferric-dicitrate binding protein FerR (iron transport regulator)
MDSDREKESRIENDYLWDGSGEPDTEVQKLEALLAKYRHDRPAPVFPAVLPERKWAPLRWPMRLSLVAAGAILLAIAVVGFLTYERQHQPPISGGWNVSRVAGSPRLGRQVLNTRGALKVGEAVETDNQSRAKLQADDVGEIEMEPDTRLRLVGMGGLKRISLDHGIIHAFIWSPPGQFVVDTPSATAVDLGCAYTLEVDDSGSGTVRTKLGWVGFKLDGHESFIPAGAVCATRPKVGPGTPYFEDASEEFRSALKRFDFEDSDPQKRAHDVGTMLADARKQDALTLWHMLSRVGEEKRGQVYDRLAEFVPPPASVTKDGILRLDQSMLDDWWNSLGFDDISVWRRWEHSWAGELGPKK